MGGVEIEDMVVYELEVNEEGGKDAYLVDSNHLNYYLHEFMEYWCNIP